MYKGQRHLIYFITDFIIPDFVGVDMVFDEGGTLIFLSKKLQVKQGNDFLLHLFYFQSPYMPSPPEK